MNRHILNIISINNLSMAKRLRGGICRLIAVNGSVFFTDVMALVTGGLLTAGLPPAQGINIV